jgi:hypothetical protein
MRDFRFLEGSVVNLAACDVRFVVFSMHDQRRRDVCFSGSDRG